MLLLATCFCQGSGNIEGVVLNLKTKEEIEWSGTAFEKMNNLRILIIRNVRFSIGPNYLPNSLRVIEWEKYPSECLPPSFNPRKLSILSLPNSSVKLEKIFQPLQVSLVALLPFLLHASFSN